MLIVQRIRTEWSKRSRGGEAAAIRNAVPESPALPIVGGGSNGLIHDVQHGECDDFRPRETLRHVEFDDTRQLDSMVVDRRVDHVTVRFVWSWHGTGAPERKSHDAFVLRAGQWGRLKCNGRFADADQGTWWYRQDVFNVAWMQALDPNRFVNTIPDFEVVELARLW